MLEKHANKLNWYLVSKFQKLPEKFIEDFQNKVNWQDIFDYQTSLSPEFKEKWKHKINK